MSLNKACVEKLLLEVERSIITAVSHTSKPYEDMSDAEKARRLHIERSKQQYTLSTYS